MQSAPPISPERKLLGDSDVKVWKLYCCLNVFICHGSYSACSKVTLKCDHTMKALAKLWRISSCLALIGVVGSAKPQALHGFDKGWRYQFLKYLLDLFPILWTTPPQDTWKGHPSEMSPVSLVIFLNLSVVFSLVQRNSNLLLQAEEEKNANLLWNKTSCQGLTIYFKPCIQQTEPWWDKLRLWFCPPVHRLVHSIKLIRWHVLQITMEGDQMKERLVNMFRLVTVYIMSVKTSHQDFIMM